MKKAIAAIISIMLMLNFSTGVFAAQGGKITFEVARTEVVDGYADVVVKITENEGVAGFKLKIEYDADVLVPQSVQKGSMIKSGYFIPNFDDAVESGKSYITVFWSNAANMKTTGEAFTIRFSITGKTFDETSIHLDYTVGDIADQNLNDLEVTLVDGVVVFDENEPPEYTIVSVIGDASQPKFDVELTLTKNSEGEAADYIMLAVYSDGMLYDLIHWKTSISKGQTRTLSGSMYGCEGAVMKAFVWDSLSGMTSLSNVIEN